MMKTYLGCAGMLGLVLLATHLPAQTPAPAPSPSVASPAERDLEKTWASIEQQTPGLASRDAMSFAMKATARHWHPERVTQALKLLATMQDRDPASKTHGNFRWDLSLPHPVDLNAVEFTMQNGILFWNLYRSSLNPDDRACLKQLIDLSVHGIESHPVKVEYTNIFLMKSWNCIAIGEAFGNPELAEEGYRMLDQWIDFTYHNGLTEYNSPTYLGVDVDDLALIDKYAGRSKGQAEADAALRYIWLQCRANWFAPDERLGGAHSRDYDYLTGHGYLDKHLKEWGWIMDKTAPVVGDAPLNLTSWPAPDMSSHASAWVVPRFLWQKCGQKPGQYATQYVGPSVSIGAAGTSSGAEDKIFTINFDGGPKMVMANFFVDGRDDSYGQNKVRLKDGHAKAHHLSPFVTSAQAGPDVLFLSSVGSPAAHKVAPEEMAAGLRSHLDIPEEAAVWQGGAELKVASGRSAPLDPAQPVFLRYHGTAVGLKFIQATDVAGKPIAPVFYRDGDAYHAARISWTHAPAAAPGEAHVLFLAGVAENLVDPGFQQFQKQFSAAKITSQFQDNKISAEVEMADHSKLSIEADLQTGDRTLATPQPSGILEVNGVEVGQPVLADALKNPSASPNVSAKQ